MDLAKGTAFEMIARFVLSHRSTACGKRETRIRSSL